MKNAILIGLFIMGLAFQGISQDVIFEAKLKKEDVPQILNEVIVEDFPEFEIAEVSAIPIEFIDDDVIINKIGEDKDYQTYELRLTGKGRVIQATYDKDGNLKSSYEYLKNIPLPLKVTKTIGKNYPGWAITEDNLKVVSYGKKTRVERYKVTLTKGNDRKKVYLDTDGHFIKES